MLKEQQILSLLLNQNQDNDCGAFIVRFMIGGHPIHVIVDDYFPICKDGSWAGVHSTSNDHWMMVVEKAYAKLFGGYDKI